jgi:1,4-alpha-glucan branching enzyme
MKEQGQTLKHFSLLTDHDIYLFKEGNHFRLHDKLGAHLVEVDGVKGTFFAVWAPDAVRVSVVGDFNRWAPGSHPMNLRPDNSGIWECFIPELGQGTIYKYHIESRYNNYRVNKGDPFAFYWELPPNTASVVWDLTYKWGDDTWCRKRLLSYRELAPMLADYLKEMGFTHVEFLPVMEHPFYPSWGYQTGGYFAPTRRYGCCQDLMYLIDHLHQNDIGVILDWVPSHFPTDEYGLGYFDGTHLFEHADPRQGFHPDWKSAIYNYGRNEVRSYLISSALFWLEKYHADVLRVDAVASMLYLDYSRQEGEWIANEKGGRENIEAISFLRRFNEMVYRDFPNAQTIAEESTAWPMVTRPVETGGLGFGMKWNMGWMHDTLEYFSMDPIYRKYHQNKLTFSIWYAFSENFVLALSHDEVVHGKGSLYGKMPGDPWQKLANLRLLFGYMYTHPGKKLLFMGSEIGQHREWNFKHSLDWHVLDDPGHEKLQHWVRDLNRLYRDEPAMYELDFHGDGFAWIDFHDTDNSVISYLRRDSTGQRLLAVILNFTPVPRHDYRIGVAHGGSWEEILNSDAQEYGGSGHGNMGGIKASSDSFYGNFDYTLSVTLPPLGMVVFRKDLTKDTEKRPSEK